MICVVSSKEYCIGIDYYSLPFTGDSVISCLERLFWVGVVICGFVCAFLLLKTNIYEWTENPMSEINFSRIPQAKD